LGLEAALENRSQREIARITGVDRATIGTVLAGTSWPDLATIAKLEIGLGRRLWPAVEGVPEWAAVGRTEIELWAVHNWPVLLTSGLMSERGPD
jgi:transcriptional regulator with XRE-family HTH domain